MTVTQHGGTSSRAPMAANGMPFATGIGRATVVHDHVGTILLVVKPWDLVSCSSSLERLGEAGWLPDVRSEESLLY